MVILYIYLTCWRMKSMFYARQHRPWCHVAAAWGCFTTPWDREKFDYLLISVVLGSDVVQLNSSVVYLKT
jgi:hypothetical protein